MFFLSQSMENLYGPGSEGSPPSVEESEEGECLWGVGAARTGVAAIGTEHCPLIGCLPPKEVDILLQRCEGGVDAALQYAKDMAKYMKDLISYLDKRTTLGEGRGDTRTGLGGGSGEGHFRSLIRTPISGRDGICQRSTEGCSQLQTEHHT